MMPAHHTRRTTQPGNHARPPVGSRFTFAQGFGVARRCVQRRQRGPFCWENV